MCGVHTPHHMPAKQSPLTSFEMLANILEMLNEHKTNGKVSKQDVVDAVRAQIYNTITALILHPFRHSMALPFTPS